LLVRRKKSLGGGGGRKGGGGERRESCSPLPSAKLPHREERGGREGYKRKSPSEHVFIARFRGKRRGKKGKKKKRNGKGETILSLPSSATNAERLDLGERKENPPQEE